MPWLVCNSQKSVFETRDLYNGEDVSPERPYGRVGSCPREWIDYLADPERRENVSLAATMTPLTMILSTNRRDLTDNIETYDVGDFTISDRVKNIIEKHEPHKHYFFRCNILRTDFSPWYQNYWSFKSGPTSVFQALIVEQSERLHWEAYKSRSPENYRHYLNFDVGRTKPTLTGLVHQAVDFSAGLTLDEKAFSSRHIVKEAVYVRQKPVFMSDALVADLKREKVTGFKFGKVKTAVRTAPPYGVSDGNGAVA
jgi:hypothetical protein